MTDNAYTIRIPKWLLGTVAAAVLTGGAFTAGLIVADNDGTTTVVGQETTTSTTASTVVETTTTVVATTTTAKPVANGGNSGGGKKPAPVPLSAGITITDNCPAEGLANIVPGVLTIKWTSTSAVARSMKVDHGSLSLMAWGDPGTANGTKTFNVTCNNQKDALGRNNGKTLVVLATLTVTGSDGKAVTARAEGTT